MDKLVQYFCIDSVAKHSPLELQNSSNFDMCSSGKTNLFKHFYADYCHFCNKDAPLLNCL